MKWSNLPRLEERNNDFAVSYSSRDRGEIAPILEGMRARGYRVFEYVDDLARAWGTKLGKRLDEVFSGSAALYVLFLSPHYWAGHWTRYEFEKIALTSSRGTNQDIVAFLLGGSEGPRSQLPLRRPAVGRAFDRSGVPFPRTQACGRRGAARHNGGTRNVLPLRHVPTHN
jgi:hypothetical protein